MTQRLREQLLEESKYGLSMTFTRKLKQGFREILNFWQAIWDCVLRPLGIHDHSVVMALQRKSSRIISLNRME